MADTPNVKFKVTNNLLPSQDPGEFIAFVEGRTTRGPINDPKHLIRSWPEFKRIYGGYRKDTDFPHLCKRMLDRGVTLRVNRLGHYTDITNAATLDAVKAATGIRQYILTFSGDTSVGETVKIYVDGVEYIWTVSQAHDTSMAAMTAYLKYVVDAIVEGVYDPAGGTNGTITFTMGSDAAITGSTITGPGSPPTAPITTNIAAADIEDDSNNELFDILPKSYGHDGNRIGIAIKDASNGMASRFDLEITHDQEPELNEYYSNLYIPSTPTVEEQNWADAVNANSNLIEVSYIDLSGLSAPIRPQNIFLQLTGGSDGSALTDSDYVGDGASSTGLQAFNGYDDGYVISAPEMDTLAVNLGLVAYADARRDLAGIVHLGNAYTTKDAIIGEKDNLNVDSEYIIPIAGGLKVMNPKTSVEEEISEAADLIGCMAFTFNEAQPWYSPFGQNRGVIPNALGVVNNFGSIGSFDDLNALSNAQINMAITRNNKIFFQNNTNARRTDDALQQVGVLMLVLYIKKQLRPVLEGFIEEPNDIPTFKQIYNTVKPFLDKLVTDRGVFEYQWNGDQDVNSIADVQINNPTDIQNGHYLVNLAIKPIGALKFITVDIILTDAGVEFS